MARYRDKDMQRPKHLSFLALRAELSAAPQGVAALMTALAAQGELELQFQAAVLSSLGEQARTSFHFFYALTFLFYKCYYKKRPIRR